MTQMYIPGMGLGYQEWGQGVYQPDVVFLHDLGQNAFVWRTLAKSLEDTGFRFLALDLPGHGDSAPCPWGHSLPAVRPVLEAFRAGMGLACPVWVATGFSTKILLDYAVHYPEQVRSMVLIEPVEPSATPVWRRLSPYWAMRRWLSAAGPFAGVRPMLEAGSRLRPYRYGWDEPAYRWPDSGKSPVAHSFVAGMQQGTDGKWRAKLAPETYQRYLEALLATEVPLEQVSSPALLVERSRTKGAAAQTLQRALGAELVRLRPDEDALVRPGEFLAELRRWIQHDHVALAPL